MLDWIAAADPGAPHTAYLHLEQALQPLLLMLHQRQLGSGSQSRRRKTSCIRGLAFTVERDTATVDSGRFTFSEPSTSMVRR